MVLIGSALLRRASCCGIVLTRVARGRSLLCLGTTLPYTQFRMQATIALPQLVRPQLEFVPGLHVLSTRSKSPE